MFEGGPLTIYYQCLDALITTGLSQQYRVIAFVHRSELFESYRDHVELIELPKSRRSYLYRLYYEYCYFYHFSKKQHVDIWISLHDITPRVRADRLYTYCHNPSPFMKKDVRTIKYSLTNTLFSFFYKYLYRINIQNATAVILQQDWIRKEFVRMFPVKKAIVARPEQVIHYRAADDRMEQDHKTTFIFPALPRFFKNFEVICEAAKLMDSEECEILLTIDGTENAYSKAVYEDYKNVKSITWLGVQPRERIFSLYGRADCLIFPSKLETWGLPISEFKKTGKDMLLVDLPYAHETLGTYDKVMFFKQDDSSGLADCMQQVIRGTQKYQPQVEQPVEFPFVQSWTELLQLLCGQ